MSRTIGHDEDKEKLTKPLTTSYTLLYTAKAIGQAHSSAVNFHNKNKNKCVTSQSENADLLSGICSVSLSVRLILLTFNSDLNRQTDRNGWDDDGPVKMATAAKRTFLR